MTRNMTSLGEVAQFINGAAFKPEDWGDSGFPIIRIQNLTDESKPFNRTTRTVAEKLQVHPGDLLVSWSATLGVFTWKRPEIGLLNQHIFRVIPDESKVDKAYLRLALSGALSAMQKHLHGATMQHVNRGEFLGTPLYLPPLEEQRRIAAILDQAETLRTQRRTALALLDSLTQSLFLDMFGDPVANPKGFKTCLLGDIIEFVGGSQPAKEHFSFEPSQDSVRLVQIRDFRSDEFKTYIPRKLAKRFFEVDDVMIGRYGPPVFQIFRGLSGSYNVALMKALPKAGVLRDFIFFLLQEPGLHGYVVDRSTRTAGQSGVNLELLENYPAFIPPLPLQQTFATRIASIEALKATHRRALAALDALFASLQQRAFTGAL